MRIQVHILDGPLPAELPPCFGEDAGALLRFEGIVRPTEDGRPITGLTYEVYQPMAGRELHRLGETAVAEFGLLGLTAEHSAGFVSAGERSFRLQVTARHRKEALAALDWFIDRLKVDVPIWKSAVFADAER
jgi:molybdopterin synthase catalytic subunit